MSNRMLIALAAFLMAGLWFSAFQVWGQTNPDNIFFPHVVTYLQRQGFVNLEWEFRIGEGGAWVAIPSSPPVPVQAYDTIIDLPFADGEIRSRVPDQGDGNGPGVWATETVPEPGLALSVAAGALLLRRLWGRGGPGHDTGDPPAPDALS